MNSAIIIFVKNPVLGHCKTRLAATIGDEAALNVYVNLLHYTKSLLQQTDVPCYVFYDQKIIEDDLFNGDQFIKRVQLGGNDLGLKMQAAFNEVLPHHDSALILGSDCAALEKNHIEQAIDALQFKNAVIGPAEDGGYYGLGLKSVETVLFTNKQWSTETVFKDTIADFRKLNWEFEILPELSDIDVETDVEKLSKTKQEMLYQKR